MGLQTRIVGRLPLFLGEYNSEKKYQTMNRVSYYGSEFQVGFDENNKYTTTQGVAPCNEPVKEVTPDGQIKWIITPNAPWIVVSDLTTAYMNSATLKDIEVSINDLNQKISDTSAGINERIDGIVDQYLKEVESPEFVEVHTDNEDKVLYGVHEDGNFYFGCGVPSQIKSYVESFNPGLNPDFNGVVYYGIYDDPLSEFNYSRAVSMSIAGVYQVNTEVGSHIYFFVPSDAGTFYATMNGFEIPFTEEQITIAGNPYRKYESVNTYDNTSFNIILA